MKNPKTNIRDKNQHKDAFKTLLQIWWFGGINLLHVLFFCCDLVFDIATKYIIPLNIIMNRLCFVLPHPFHLNVY